MSRRASSSAFESDTEPLLHARLETLFQHLPGAIDGREEDLHEMRVACRRLRVALPLLATRARGRRARRARQRLRGLVRAGGRGRDFDVMLGLLDQREREAEASERLPRLRRSLRAAHSRSRKGTAAALLDEEIAGLRRDLRAVGGKGTLGVFAAMARVRAARDAVGFALRSAIEELGERFDPVRLHWMRRRVRQLRYVGELQAELQGRPAKASQQLKKLQQVLGELNDAFVLASWLEGREAAARDRGNEALAAEASRLREWAHQRARRRHRAWLAREPAEVVRRALSSLGSRLSPPPASAPGVGPPGSRRVVPDQ